MGLKREADVVEVYGRRLEGRRGRSQPSAQQTPPTLSASVVRLYQSL